ncbi:MAG: hypothetical protein EPO28_04260 [Saprospiraceae bacterium]|nr:MAG: hypothetical protein EPO28_04260 [Saprospiraceae bacterium]
MKKLLFGTLLLFAFAVGTYAQPGSRQGPIAARAQEKIAAYKIAFFTEQLQLTPEESKDFWPLYNQFEDERDKLKDKGDFQGKKIELMADKELEDFIVQQLDMEEQQVKLKRDYVHRFMQVLPIRKVAMLQRTELEFKRQLLDEMKRRQENRQDAKPRKPRN